MIGSTSSSVRRIGYLSAGRNDGERPGMPATSPTGLVGRVLEAGAQLAGAAARPAAAMGRPAARPVRRPLLRPARRQRRAAVLAHPVAIELIEIRSPWRNFWIDWLTASAILVIYLAIAALFSGAELTLVQLRVILPQLMLSIMLFPVIARLVAYLDRLRLMRVRRLG